MPSTPPISTRDITLANRDSMGFFNEPSSPSPSSPSPYHSPDLSITLDSPSKRGRGLQRNRRVSDTSMLSADLGYQYPCVLVLLLSWSAIDILFVFVLLYRIDSTPNRDSYEEEDPQHVLSSMQNSMWGGQFHHAGLIFHLSALTYSQQK